MDIKKTKTGLVVDGEVYTDQSITDLNKELEEIVKELLSESRMLADRKQEADDLNNERRNHINKNRNVDGVELDVAVEKLEEIEERIKSNNELKKMHEIEMSRLTKLQKMRKAALDREYSRLENEVKNSASLNQFGENKAPKDTTFADRPREIKPVTPAKVEKFSDTAEGKAVAEQETQDAARKQREAVERAKQEIARQKKEQEKEGITYNGGISR